VPFDDIERSIRQVMRLWDGLVGDRKSG
jgi:hypothetical protein